VFSQMNYLHSVRHYERACPVTGQSTRSNGGTPLLSVGIPVFNGGGLLVEAIDSILGQTLADFELIIADNASTDETPTICAGYAARDSRIRVIRHRENIGAPRNWNFVARESRGRYFKWASASDRCAPRS
jgi:glycosyltransferase involved in cell wall biosynthesis